jgi:alkanesulfonate monooxygenase SsuD/methylene tetrahydromethanopterin reductase-like flavin-dependent oxidoreductase (luciferase family)
VTDYGHQLLFGAALAPNAAEHSAVLEVAESAEDLGLDIVGFQDHPYQPAFLDTWTLLSFLAGRTHHVRLFPNVANVPLRPPAVLARSAASLDILSGGRLELGLGAGYFLDPIVAMGGPRRTMSEHVDALAEAIEVIRSLWRPGPPVRFKGSYYSLEGARPGPAPAHPIAIWLGAYKRRMLQLTGRAADGWIPSLGYAAPEDLARMNRTIDAAAGAAGRDPAEIRRLQHQRLLWPPRRRIPAGASRGVGRAAHGACPGAGDERLHPRLRAGVGGRSPALRR